jgi:hypothetical protein
MAIPNRQKHIDTLNRVALAATRLSGIRDRRRPFSGRSQPRIIAGRNADIERGFVLVLTLVVILALSIATEVMTRWVSSALDQALANRQQVETRQKIDEAAALSFYILGTRPVSLRGIESLGVIKPAASSAPEMIAAFDPMRGYIRLDDRPYRLGDIVLRFQDARGLINLNFGSEADLYSLLDLFGIKSEDRDPLIAKLQDYIDPDPFTRLNGAEAPQYAAAGREPPTNKPLRTPWEVRRILDWDKIDDIARDDTRWPLLTTTGDIAGFNVNTAPAALLRLMPGMSEGAADNVIRWRRDQPITDASEFGSLTGIPMPRGPSRFLPFPSDQFVITLSAKEVPLERHIAVRLTPQLRDQPWSIDYDIETPRASRGDRDANANPDGFPVPDILSAAP